MIDLEDLLHEKDMKLTDIRLEALSSAHQLDQLKDTMTRMKVSVHPDDQGSSRTQQAKLKETSFTSMCLWGGGGDKEIVFGEETLV